MSTKLEYLIGDKKESKISAEIDENKLNIILENKNGEIKRVSYFVREKDYRKSIS